MRPRPSCQLLNAFAGVLMLFLLVFVPPGYGHEKKAVGSVHLIIGWGAEPAFSGSRNSIEIDVVDGAGKPVASPGDSLSVQVTFADRSVTLALVPAGDRPGRFRAWLVPTRAGSYTFRVSGTAAGRSIETTSTCSPTTFDCVIDSSDMQFPAKDPSAAEIAERVNRALPRAERAIDASTRAWWMGAGAMLLSACALAGVGLGAMRRANGTRG